MIFNIKFSRANIERSNSRNNKLEEKMILSKWFLKLNKHESKNLIDSKNPSPYKKPRFVSDNTISLDLTISLLNL